jgi:peptidoglycan/LPS O-acetylase OafA/YrhL
MKRLHYVDTLRFLASTAVLAQHLLEHVDRVRFDPFLQCAPGVFGVVLFFYVSGLSIPLSVRKNPPLAAFLLRRVFRIFPAYLFSLAIVGVLAVIGMAFWRENLGRLGVGAGLANLVLLQEWIGAPSVLGVTWTLSLEFFWYGLFAFIFYVVGSRNTWIAANLYSFGLLLLAVMSLLVERRLPLGRVAMVGAALVGYLTVQWQDNTLSRTRFSASVTLFVLATLISQVVSFGCFVHPTTTLTSSLVAWTAATSTFLLFAVPAKVREGPISRVPVVLFLGTISYSVYLTHSIVISVLDLVVSGALMLVLAPLFTTLVSWLMFERIERPGIELGRGVERGLLPRAPNPEAREVKPV